MFAKAHGRNHDQDIITDRSKVGIPRVVEGHERMGKTIEPVILTMAGGRFSVWSLVNGAQHSPSRVKSGPGAACYASRWDVAPGGPDRARSCHWPPLTPPRTTHCSTCPPCRLVPRVTDVETGHFSRGDIDPIISSIASQDSIDIDNHFHGTIPSDVRLFPFLLRSILLSIFRRSFRCWGEVSLDFDRIVKNKLDSMTCIEYFSSSFASLFDRH